jgi:hypothetical protein
MSCGIKRSSAETSAPVSSSLSRMPRRSWSYSIPYISDKVGLVIETEATS